MNHDMNVYRSRDLYISASILAKGIPLIKLEKETPTIFVFVFDISPEKAKKIIADHWNRKLFVASRDLIEAINELKTRLHNGI